jgi:hypothetical protein
MGGGTSVRLLKQDPASTHSSSIHAYGSFPRKYGAGNELGSAYPAGDGVLTAAEETRSENSAAFSRSSRCGCRVRKAGSFCEIVTVTPVARSETGHSTAPGCARSPDHAPFAAPGCALVSQPRTMSRCHRARVYRTRYRRTSLTVFGSFFSSSASRSLACSVRADGCSPSAGFS